MKLFMDDTILHSVQPRVVEISDSDIDQAVIAASPNVKNVAPADRRLVRRVIASIMRGINTIRFESSE